MNVDLNTVTVIGRLTQDVKTRMVGDKNVSSFSIASNYYSKQEGAVNYFDIEYWNCKIGQYLTKGKQVAVEGELRQERWTDKDGKSHSRIKVVARGIHLLGGHKKSDSDPETNPFED